MTEMYIKKYVEGAERLNNKPERFSPLSSGFVRVTKARTVREFWNSRFRKLDDESINRYGDIVVN